MIPWVLCGVLFLTLLLVGLGLFGMQAIYNAKMRELMVEAEKLNQRWKITAESMVLRATREAVFEERDWTDVDEERFQRSLDVLEQNGIPLESVGVLPKDRDPDRSKKPKTVPAHYH